MWAACCGARRESCDLTRQRWRGQELGHQFRYAAEEVGASGSSEGEGAAVDQAAQAEAGGEEKGEGEGEDEGDPLLGTPAMLQWAGPRPEGRAFCLARAPWSTADRPPRDEGLGVPPRIAALPGSAAARQEPALVPNELQHAASPLLARLRCGSGSGSVPLRILAAAGTAAAAERARARALEAAVSEAGTQRVVDQLRRLRRGAYDGLIGRVKEEVMRGADVEQEFARLEQEAGAAAGRTAARPPLWRRLWLRVRRGAHRGEVPPGVEDWGEWRCALPPSLVAPCGTGGHCRPLPE